MLSFLYLLKTPENLWLKWIKRVTKVDLVFSMVTFKTIFALIGVSKFLILLVFFSRIIQLTH